MRIEAPARRLGPRREGYSAALGISIASTASPPSTVAEIDARVVSFQASKVAGRASRAARPSGDSSMPFSRMARCAQRSRIALVEWTKEMPVQPMPSN